MEAVGVGLSESGNSVSVVFEAVLLGFDIDAHRDNHQSDPIRPNWESNALDNTIPRITNPAAAKYP